MAWSNLQSNQMVSFTDAQTSGFTLVAGQSHVTSNQCMTKSEALAKYNLNVSSMDGYTSNQLVPKSTWVTGVVVSHSFIFSNVGYLSSSTSCSNTNTGITLYTTQNFLTSGITMYNNAALTTPFNGSNNFWHSSTSTWRIQSDGIISGGFGC